MRDYNPYETCDRCLLDTSIDGHCSNCSYEDPHMNTPTAEARRKEERRKLDEYYANCNFKSFK